MNRSQSYHMSAIQNLHSLTPLLMQVRDDLLPAGTEHHIHIRIQQIKGRKILKDYNKKKLVKAFRKKFAHSGTLIEHPEYGEVIQLRDDQLTNKSQFVVENGLAGMTS
ncbi:Eukaryotic translation initiation factor 1 [Galemys pyrenaicus]|uniref:Eukaryotic translation initiation factor 1 n=1 Tax=Galemys pyrenaicus TaxID=202257 RepID=A0A8J6ABJ2_GALPY|nr:Eukaryotic translation initiation factor 1 [Galemys pyrenaicus]